MFDDRYYSFRSDFSNIAHTNALTYYTYNTHSIKCTTQYILVKCIAYIRLVYIVLHICCTKYYNVHVHMWYAING